MSETDPENPFRPPDTSVRQFKVTSNPSIEFEPHLRSSEETLKSPDHESVWNEPILARGGFRTGTSPEIPKSKNQHGYVMAGVVIVGVVAIAVALLVLFF